MVSNAVLYKTVSRHGAYFTNDSTVSMIVYELSIFIVTTWGAAFLPHPVVRNKNPVTMKKYAFKFYFLMSAAALFIVCRKE